MRKLITRVLVTVMLDGARTDIQPGEPLPEGVHEHDIEQLLKMRAIEDVAATAKAETDAAKAEKVASQDYVEAREAVQAARESTQSAGAVLDPAPGSSAETGADAEAQAKADAEAKAKAGAEAKAKASGKVGAAAKGGKSSK